MDFIPISNQLSNFQRAFLLRFYRSQFWRLQKPVSMSAGGVEGFIGHNFGDYKNSSFFWWIMRASFIGHNFGDYKNASTWAKTPILVLSVTILETTKTVPKETFSYFPFYRSQFWRLQKHNGEPVSDFARFIGHNFGDYKNLKWYQLITP